MLLLALAALYWTKSSPLTHTHMHTHSFKGPFSGTTQVSRYQKGKSNLDFTEARDSEWQWQQLGHMQVCTSLQKDNHASTPPLSFLQARCPSCQPTNSVKALKAWTEIKQIKTQQTCSAASVYCWLFHSHFSLWSVTKNTHTKWT